MKITYLGSTYQFNINMTSSYQFNINMAIFINMILITSLLLCNPEAARMRVNIADQVIKVIEDFGIQSRLGYFVLDNARITILQCAVSPSTSSLTRSSVASTVRAISSIWSRAISCSDLI
jgi:hypothetical protein